MNNALMKPTSHNQHEPPASHPNPNHFVSPCCSQPTIQTQPLPAFSISKQMGLPDSSDGARPIAIAQPGSTLPPTGSDVVTLTHMAPATSPDTICLADPSVPVDTAAGAVPAVGTAPGDEAGRNAPSAAAGDSAVAVIQAPATIDATAPTPAQVEAVTVAGAVLGSGAVVPASSGAVGIVTSVATADLIVSSASAPADTAHATPATAATAASSSTASDGVAVPLAVQLNVSEAMSVCPVSKEEAVSSAGGTPGIGPMKAAVAGGAAASGTGAAASGTGAAAGMAASPAAAKAPVPGAANPAADGTKAPPIPPTAAKKSPVGPLAGFPTWQMPAPSVATPCCPHYARYCHLRAPCCNALVACRRCHDALVPDGHPMDRRAVKYVKCLNCDSKDQPIAASCKFCGTRFASYFCTECCLYDDTTNREIFHCPGCGVCRVGLQIDYKHCDACKACIPVASFDDHKCAKNVLAKPCSLCRIDMHESVRRCTIPPCGHAMHQGCFEHYVKSSYSCPTCGKSLADMSRFWAKLDKLLEKELLAQTAMIDILCRDCGNASSAKRHPEFHKCGEIVCGSYNTKVKR